MIFIANVLVLNGGTTFLLRLVRERARSGKRSAVLLLSDRVDPVLLTALSKDATILHLRDFLIDRGVAARGLLGVFAPLAHDRLHSALKVFGNHIHSMSLFGLMLGLRMAGHADQFRVSVGIYHQNEFVYQPPPFHFAREAQRIFKATPPANIVFFNEYSRDNYAAFFDNDYAASPLLPIGVTLDMPPLPAPAVLGQRIVSVGNLVGFKTYNRLMIGVVAALRARFPSIRYDIYGVGPTEGELKALIETLGVGDHVTLRGSLDYSLMRDVVADCDLFVGSGTALIEAAAVGRPALIGIESIEEPLTYGFLSDARGFSYNEDMPDVPKLPIVQLVEHLFSDPTEWAQIAAACATKAQSFSIAVTAGGFDMLEQTAEQIPIKLSGQDLGRLAISAMIMRISERLGLSEPFGDRRNQSYRS